MPETPTTDDSDSERPGLLHTYSGTQAAEIVGITREGFYRIMKKYPLVPDVMHNSAPGWTRESLLEWHAAIPSPGRRKKS